MIKITEKDLTLLLKQAPGFLRSIEKAKKEHADYVLMSILGFASETENVLLKTCLQYAYKQGVAVLFIPDEKLETT